jgi:hypothetical protein
VGEEEEGQTVLVVVVVVVVVVVDGEGALASPPIADYCLLSPAMKHLQELETPHPLVDEIT